MIITGKNLHKIKKDKRQVAYLFLCSYNYNFVVYIVSFPVCRGAIYLTKQSKFYYNKGIKLQGRIGNFA